MIHSWGSKFVAIVFSLIHTENYHFVGTCTGICGSDSPRKPLKLVPHTVHPTPYLRQPRFRSASLLSPLADLGRFLKLKHDDRAGVRATNQITRYKTSLECVGNGVPQVDDLSNCLLSPQVQFYVRSGRISPNY